MAMEVTKGVWNLDPEGAGFYLIEGDSACLLLDSGFGGMDIPNVLKRLVGEKPVRLVNTHYHMDHAGGNHYFQSACAHPKEFPKLRAVSGELIPVQEGQSFELGGRRLQVLECPGHTPGGIALLDAENHILFSGDMVATVPIWMQGPDADLKAYIASMDKFLALGDKVQTVLGCHGPMPQPLSRCTELKALAQKILDGSLVGPVRNMRDQGGPQEDIRLCQDGNVSMFRPV